MQIAYGRSAYRRDQGGMPELRLVNMFVEKAPTAGQGVTLQSRPGLALVSEIGIGPVVGLYRQAGVFGGDTFGVSGSTLYRGPVALGAVAGPLRPSFASSPLEVLVALGGPLFRTDGVTVAAVAFPDNAEVRAIAFLAGYFVAVRRGSNALYFCELLNGNSWSGDDYASAESAPDELLDVVVVGSELFLLGQSTIEPWQPTGNPDIPFIPSAIRLYRRGVISSGCAVATDNSLLWIGDDRICYRAGAVPERISDHGIEERIAQSTTFAAFGFQWEGHNFFCIRLDQGTWAYDISSGQWCEFASIGRDNWRALCAVTIEGAPLFGDDSSGKVWSFSGFTEDGDALERLFTAAAPMSAGAASIDNLTIDANVGQTELLSGLGSEPLAEMRTSRDAGETWGPWRQAPLGRTGSYRTRTQWRRCGTFDAPGFLVEIRTTHPAPFRVSAVAVNEPGGGRSR